MGTKKRYKNIEDVFALYPTIATPSNKLVFTLEDGTKSPVFNSRQKATQWYNNYKKTHPTFSIVIGGTSTSKNTNTNKQTSKTSNVSSTVETLEQKDQRYLQKYGKTEAEAKAAQQQLIEAGYLPAGSDDGYWGDKSKAAWDAYMNDLNVVKANPEGTGIILTEKDKEQAAVNFMNRFNKHYQLPDYTDPKNGFNSGAYGSGFDKPWIDLSGTWAGDALNWTKRFINDEIFLNKGNARVNAMNTGGYLEYFKPGFDIIGHVMTPLKAWPYLIAMEGVKMYNDLDDTPSYFDLNAYIQDENGNYIHYDFLTPEQRQVYYAGIDGNLKEKSFWEKAITASTLASLYNITGKLTKVPFLRGALRTSMPELLSLYRKVNGNKIGAGAIKTASGIMDANTVLNSIYWVGNGVNGVYDWALSKFSNTSPADTKKKEPTDSTSMPLQDAKNSYVIDGDTGDTIIVDNNGNTIKGLPKASNTSKPANTSNTPTNYTVAGKDTIYDESEGDGID